MPRGRRGLNVARLKQWARAGAETTLRRLRAEVHAIERTFPELANPRRRRRKIARARRRTRQMSAAARKVVSQRMKKYWAQRRKATRKS
jgi:hypothetical protein